MNLVRLDSLFDLRYGKAKNADDFAAGPVPLVSSSAQNNGVAGYVDAEAETDGPVITVPRTGSVGWACVQMEPCIVTHNAFVMTPRRRMSRNELLFYAMAVRANGVRFGYSRPMTLPVTKALMLPADVPAWVDALTPEQAFIASATFDPATVSSMPPLPLWGEFGIDARFGESASLDVGLPLPDTSLWKTFTLTDLFTISKGTGYALMEVVAGDVPLVSAKTTDNSVATWANVEPRFAAGTITVTTDGAVGYATVQPEPFDIASNAVALIPSDDEMPLLARFFCCALIRAEGERFGYSRKLNAERLSELTIKLPVTADGDPDWQTVERFMKGMDWSAYVTESMEGEPHERGN